jgi:methylglutaconyl-CoA hydratase
MDLRKFETLDVNCDARGVASLYLNRPEKRNAFSAQMIEELSQFAQTWGQSDAVRLIVLRGSGSVFCAGGDLEWMRIQSKSDRAGRISEARKLAQMLYQMNTIPKPLIGVLHGGAFGGGVGLVSVCDVAFAHNDMKFGLTETKLGLIPATISPYVLARMGEGNARRVFMSARTFDSQEAKDLGLIAEHLDASDIEVRLEREIADYLQAAPRAVAAAKVLARKLGPEINDMVLEYTIKALADTWSEDEAKEGVASFFDRRKPHWV